MSDLAAAEREWQSWIEEACAAVGVDPALVDVAGVHELTRDIAHGFSRPMAPVGAFIWGIALGRASAVAGGPGPRGGSAAVAADATGAAGSGATDLRAAIAATAEAAAAG